MRVPFKDRPELKNCLIQTLGKGKARALLGPELAKRVQYNGSGDRQTRMMLRELRADGIPVASSTGRPAGFFIAETQQEVQDYIDQLTDRIREIAITLRDFKKASKRITQPEQLRMTIY